jgi:hypothetical protein
MGQTTLKGLVMAKKQATPKTCVIQSGMWPLTIWEQSWIKRIQSLNFLGENNFEGVQKPSQKDHLLTNGAYIGMSVWMNKEKFQGFGLVHSLLRKVGNSHLIQGVV